MAADPPQRPPLVIVNPRASKLASSARRAAIRHDLERVLRARYRLEPDWIEGSHADALAALRETEGRPLVVAVGGDGTIREAADATRGTGTPVAIVPGGTGNVLAGALRIRGMAGALEVIRAGHERRLDLGRARWGGIDGDEHERTFTVASGTGFDARMIAAAEGPWKRHLGFGAYVKAALREIPRTRPARFRIVADGAVLDLVGLVVLVVNIGELVPGRLGPRRSIAPDDGRLELVVVGGRDLLAGLLGAAELLLRAGELDSRVIRRSVQHVRVESDPPQLVETDGDAHPPGWLEASVLPGALTVLAPGP